MKKPNIVFILSDQHNGEILGAAGDKWIRTPNIDALADSGVNCANAYCNSPLCVPSRSSMLSGLLPDKTGIFNNTQSLRGDRATFVHCLAASGYETVLCGRMHFVGPDQRHGYEKRLVGDICSSFGNYNVRAESRYGYLDGCATQKRIAIEKSGKGMCSVMPYDTDVKNAAVELLENRTDERPIFLTVGLYGPHNPYVAREDLFDYYYGILPDPKPLTEEDIENMHPAEREFLHNRGITSLTSEEIKRTQAAYYGMVEFEDRLVGEIVEAVERTLGLENTIIIYTSDHGDCMGKHGLFWKSNFREGAAHVPLIFSWKGRFQQGKKLTGLTSLLDIAPTLLEVSGSIYLPEFDGESILEFLETDSQIAEDKYVVSEIIDIKKDNPAAMVRRGRYKLIRHSGYEQVMMFDLSEDPDEMHDIGSDPKFESIRMELLELLGRHWDEQKSFEILDLSRRHVDILVDCMKQQKGILYDEWPQEGEERNQNYLIVDGKILS